MTQTRFAALQGLAILLLLTVLLYWLGPVLSPFLAAAIFAYICQPLVSRLSCKKMSRTTATLLVMGGLLILGGLLAMLLFPLLRSEIDALLLRLPDLIEVVRDKLFSAQAQLGQGAQWGQDSWKSLLTGHLQDAGSVANKLLPWLSGGGAAILGVLMNLLLIPLAMFYLLRDWPELIARMELLIPRRWHVQTVSIIHEIDDILAQFMRGQLLVMLLMSGFYSLGLWLVGIEFALPIGIVSGLLVFIPYVGVIVGVSLASLVAFTQLGEWSAVFWVWFVFGIGQLLEGMVVTPKFVGERIGLHPLAVVFALLAFGQMFGFFGVLLALPMAAVLLVALRHFRTWYLTSDLYRESK